MLVPWGLSAPPIGLVEAREGVPIPQRTRDHTPQTKLIEFLASILTGCAHLTDIAQDQAEQAQAHLAQGDQKRYQWDCRVAELEVIYQARNRPERPHSRLAQGGLSLLSPL
jgi:hypothetical protein